MSRQKMGDVQSGASRTRVLRGYPRNKYVLVLLTKTFEPPLKAPVLTPFDRGISAPAMHISMTPMGTPSAAVRTPSHLPVKQA